VAGAVHRPEEGQGALEDGAGGRQLPQAPQDAAEAAQGAGDLGVVARVAGGRS
jgi:hypothetical protein